MTLTENHRRALKASSAFVSYLIEGKQEHGGDLGVPLISKLADKMTTIVNTTLEEAMPSEPTTAVKTARTIPTFDAERVTRKLERAGEERDAGLAKVRQPDGSPMYAPAIQSEKEAAVTAMYEQATQAVMADIEQAIGDAERELQTIGREPLARLSADELARASVLRPFVMDEAERLDTKHLVELAEQALIAKDRPLMTLYHRSLRFIVEGVQRQQIASRGNLPSGASASAQLASSMIERLGAALADPQDEPRRQRARENMAAANKVRSTFTSKVMVDKYLKQAYGRR